MLILNKQATNGIWRKVVKEQVCRQHWDDRVLGIVGKSFGARGSRGQWEDGWGHGLMEWHREGSWLEREHPRS